MSFSERRKIKKEFVRYAVPSVAGMVVSSLYTVIDGIFVGRGVGDLALGGVNIVFPFIMLIISLTMLVAIGGANLAAFARGRGDGAGANNMFRQSLILLFAVGAALSLAAFFFNRELCLLLGADALLLSPAETYLRSMAPFVAVQTIGLGLSVFVRNDGSPNLAMLGTIAGAIINIILDYVFIMIWDWGIEGAAIATGIGLSFEFIVYASHFVRRSGQFRIGRPVFSVRDTGRLLYNGLSSFLMEFCQSAIAFSFNIVIMAYMGATGVAAYGVVTYICSSFNMILIGITQGAQPIISYNHGLNKPEAVVNIHALGCKSSLIVSVLFVAACLLFTGQLVGLFIVDSPELSELTGRMLAYVCVGYVPVGLTLMNILFFQATEREGRSTLVSVLRCLGFVQLFLLILPRYWGEYGIYLSFFCGETCNWLTSAVLYIAIDPPEELAAVQPVYQPIVSASGRYVARRSRKR